MTGAARAVYVYYADRRTLSDELVGALVTPEDGQSLAPGAQPRRRAEYLAARALLRHALEHHTGRVAASLRILVAASGKPECVGGPAISVSHSGDLVACALADGEAIGIDIETTRPRASATAIAERYFTPAEARWLGADPETRFRMLWVLKEAYLKGLGVGLAGGLHSLECLVEPPAIIARVAGGGAPPQLALLAGQDCYAAIAAPSAQRLEIVATRWSPDARSDAFGPLAVIAKTE